MRTGLGTRKLFIGIYMLIMFLGIVSCTNLPTLNENGRRVKIYTFEPAQCKKLGTIIGNANSGPLFENDYELNKATLNDIRNKAAEKNANAIFPGKIQIKDNVGMLEAGVYKCSKEQ